MRDVSLFGFVPYPGSELFFKLLEDQKINDSIDEYEKFLSYIQKNDFFYKNKFRREKISFPYSVTILRNLKRNYGIINQARKSKKIKVKNLLF